MRRLLLALLFWFTLPAFAQLETFFTQLETLLSRNDLAGAASLVEGQPEAARQAFQMLLQVLPGAEPEEQRAGLLMLARNFGLNLWGLAVLEQQVAVRQETGGNLTEAAGYSARLEPYLKNSTRVWRRCSPAWLERGSAPLGEPSAP